MQPHYSGRTQEQKTQGHERTSHTFVAQVKKVHHMQDERHQSNPYGKLEDSAHLFCVRVAGLAAVLLRSSIELILQASPSTDGLGLWFGLPSEGSWFHVE